MAFLVYVRREDEVVIGFGRGHGRSCMRMRSRGAGYGGGTTDGRVEGARGSRRGLCD